jgi:SNF2 family DNA or RNA helicase
MGWFEYQEGMFTVRNLHGLWLPDGVFVFILQQQMAVAVSSWQHEVFAHVAYELRGSLQEQTYDFRMPTSTGWSKQTITGILIPIPHMITYLATAHAQHQRLTDIRVADDFLFWQRSAQFALELLIRGRVTPTTQLAATDYHERASAYCAWVPSLDTEADKERFFALVNAMPAVCRAYDPNTGQGWLGVPPRDILLSFLTWGMDAWIRQSITEQTRLRMQALFNENIKKTLTPLAETWVNGLIQPIIPGLLTATSQQLTQFSDQVTEWIRGSRTVHEANHHTEFFAHANMRLCLKLQVSPPDLWSLQFSLQSADDPSLLIDAEMICEGTMTDGTGLQWNLFGLQETLLTELGRAARIYPELERALEHGRPTQLEIDVFTAHHFLREVADVLQAGGFVVLLPAWWTQKGRHRLGLKLKARLPEDQTQTPFTDSHLGLQQLIQFDAMAAMGNDEVSLPELERLAALKVPLVQVSGEWTEVDAQGLQKVLDFIKSGGHGSMQLGRFLHLLADEPDTAELNSLPVVDFVVPTNLRHFMEGNLQLPDKAVPTTLNGHLRPYQERGFLWLSMMTEMGLGVCLADDMGLGKTVQIITLFLERWTTAVPEAMPSSPALVICPTTLLGNWQRELERFAPSLRVFTHHGTNRPHGLEFLRCIDHADVVLSTYHLAYRDADNLSSIEWSYLVLDEAQYIKNSKSKQTQSIYHLRATQRIALTGTPVENHLDDLWSLLHFLNPGYLGSLNHFKTHLAIPIERDQDPAKTETLQRLIKPFVLRRVKTDPTIIQDLPSKMEIKAFCTMTKEQVTLYEAAVQHLLLQMEHAGGMQRKGLILASLTKLKQICNHPAHFLHDDSRLHGRSGKLIRLLELLQEIHEANEAALIFTQYTEMGELLVRAIADELYEPALFLHGGIKQTQRDELVQQYQSGQGTGLFVLSLKAGGVGLNLTRANHVIHFDRWWNPAVENQATDRAFRIGQKRNVEVHKMICLGTLEDKIDQLIESKQALAQQVVGSGETWLSEMSNHQLRSLVELRHDIIQDEEVVTG